MYNEFKEMMTMNYETTFQIELLKEYGASISAAFYRHAREEGIDLEDKYNPINQASRNAWLLANELITAPEEVIFEIKERLHELKKYLYEVNLHAVI